jgi:catechol 2,3-dioxygenase-like lactoylglutathione lyase family enzyme
VTVLRVSVIVQSPDRQGAVDRYQRLLGAPPVDEFHIPGRDLIATVFAGLSVLSGTPEALAPLGDLRGIVFVDSLKEMEDRLVKSGWKLEGTLGPAGNALVRDPDGNLLEVVEHPAEHQTGL